MNNLPERLPPMSSSDITKPTNHIYWLWAACLFLAANGVMGYIGLRDRTERLAERAAEAETTLKVQLADIKARLIGLEASLTEIKKDIRRNERQ